MPDTGFVGRDETLLLLDRAFDAHPVVLLHAYAGQGKTAAAVSPSAGMPDRRSRPRPVVLFTSFETPMDLNDVLNQIGQQAIEGWTAIDEIGRKSERGNENPPPQARALDWDNVERRICWLPDGGPESQWTPEEQQDLADFLELSKKTKRRKPKSSSPRGADEHGWLRGIPHRVEMPRMSGSDAADLARSLGDEREDRPRGNRRLAAACSWITAAAIR